MELSTAGKAKCCISTQELPRIIYIHIYIYICIWICLGQTCSYCKSRFWYSVRANTDCGEGTLMKRSSWKHRVHLVAMKILTCCLLSKQSPFIELQLRVPQTRNLKRNDATYHVPTFHPRLLCSNGP
jgi:hypothetical protein